MAKTLDFNSLTRPALELVMADAEQTRISVTLPSEALVRRLQTAMAELQEVVARGDTDSIDAVFELVAELISNNRQLVTVTAQELREKYRLELQDVVVFVTAYADFLAEVQNAKN